MKTRLNHVAHWPELARKARWSASALAAECGVSVRTLERYFLWKMGASPKAWMAEQRQRRAAELLRDGVTVKEAAHRLHYRHPSHLTNAFKKQWGHAPTAEPR